MDNLLDVVSAIVRLESHRLEIAGQIIVNLDGAAASRRVLVAAHVSS
ncbi:hypothetical protein P3W85_28380 [Cupriavidus basilensis]|uniref:Uncharacterized protein n=1 Tax=Cupriavidus basilensis TaxID=68895 RepID=A0ABT6AW85_9BURK|nr:hypothetical protein [Cupriavidus basilensis]MDF3836838.1 hypothetical protein [Cupriavidus basilensis]